jgi:hypothetical protein
MAEKRRATRNGTEKPLEEREHREIVADLEEKMERLRVLFEQYFLGIEKRPPSDKKTEVQRIIRFLQSRRIPQAVTRFQFQGLVGRFNIFDSYWTRIMRQIEEGTYKRDLFKARLKEELREAGAAAGGAVSERPENLVPPGEAELGFGLREERLRVVYEDYLRARRYCGEPVEGITYEKVRAMLLREAPRIAEKNRLDQIDFQVVVRDGKAVLKAVGKKGGE